MAFDPTTIPPALIGTWRQLSGRTVDVESGEERPGLSKAPNGYIHFAPNGRMFNVTVNSARTKPRGAKPTAAEAEALYRSIIAYTGTYTVSGDKLYLDLDVTWNEVWTGSRQIRTWKLEGDRLMVAAEIVNPMTGKPARHQLTFEKMRD